MQFADYDCCIIGAGMSGLAAAQTLHKSGLKVIVLDGRDRIGGRVCPMLIGANLLPHDEAKAYRTVQVQLGANWIHDLRSVNPVARMAQQADLCLHETSCGKAFGDSSIIADRDHYIRFGETRWMTSSEKREASDIVLAMETDEIILRRRLKKLTAAKQHKFSVAESVERIVHRLLGKGMPVNLLPTRQLLALHLEYRGFSEGFDLSKLSFTRYLDETVEDAVHGEAFICAGTSELFSGLSKGLDIRLGCTVKKINWSACTEITAFESSAIQINATSNENFNITASNVIVTTSLGVLKQGIIEFYPSLPLDVTDCISNSEMGLMDIVVVRFDRMFWDVDTTLFAACPPLPSEKFPLEAVRSDLFSHFYNLTLIRRPVDPDSPPLLMCEVSGSKARIVESMTLSEIASSIVKTLEIIFGVGGVGTPIGCVTHQWGKDPFAFGSWMNYSIGVTPENILALQHPICQCSKKKRSNNKNIDTRKSCSMQFAGEGTSGDRIATLQGAYESGIRAALHIIHHHGSHNNV